MKSDAHKTRLEPIPPMRVRMPLGYEKLRGLSPETIQWAREHALQIFTECSNSGHSLQTCIFTVFITGLHYASTIDKPDAP